MLGKDFKIIEYLNKYLGALSICFKKEENTVLIILSFY